MGRNMTSNDNSKFVSKREFNKAEFGNRLYRIMLDRGWNQSELARRANLPRDTISTYIRGLHSPRRDNLDRIAKALNVDVADLYAHPEDTDGSPSEMGEWLDVEMDKHDRSMAWLTIRKRVPVRTAVKVLSAISEGSDEAPDAG